MFDSHHFKTEAAPKKPRGRSQFEWELHLLQQKYLKAQLADPKRVAEQNLNRLLARHTDK